MTDRVVLYAEFTARPDHVAQVERLITTLAEHARREPGNQEFTVYQRAEDPCRFFVLERYVDRGAHAAHRAAPYRVAFDAALTDHILESRAEVSFLQRAGAR